MNGIEGGGFNLPLANFWKAENIKLERAFNFAKEVPVQGLGGVVLEISKVIFEAKMSEDTDK